MPNRARPGRATKASRQRAAQRIDRRIDAAQADFVDVERRTLVEHHANVGVEQALEFDRALRRQPVPAAVDVTAELDPVLVDGPEFGERHQLIATGVGENRVRPAHEGVQAAEPGDPLDAGAEHQVVGIGEHHARAGRRHHVRRERLDRRRGSDRHEGRRRNEPVRDLEYACPRRPIAR